MSEGSLDALLQRLQSLPSGTTLSEALAAVAPPESAGVGEARRRVALVRWFDGTVYGFLCSDIAGAPGFSEFTGLPGVVRLASGRWQLAEAVREPLLAAWRATAQREDWRQWNGRLAGHFLARREELGPEAELAAVYHGAASPDPDALAGPFLEWFEAADRDFDLARGNALLEILKLQSDWRGESLSRLYAELRAYCGTRLLFADDYYKTGSYLERPEVLEEFLTVKDREPGRRPWIFHLHASGGTGKTMFIRWLLARRLVPDRILCARVDFDDFLLQEVLVEPVRLFRRIVDQLARQPGGGDFLSLAEKLGVSEVSGWAPILDEAHRQLASTQASARRLPVVVVLDTLEEATLSAEEWLRRCLAALRAWLQPLPGLTLVLSGRYDLALRSQALEDGEYLGYELPRFSDDEARRYLRSRGVPEGEVLEAIVERSGAEESGPAGDARNPFKLAMFAELALNRANLTAAEVRAYPRVDIAYLIERVVKRIESQPLRWMVRYGAVTRDLSLEFARAVLLPRLLAALRGEAADRPEEGLNGGPDVWRQDPDAAAKLTEPDGLKALWDQLAGYARDRGWLSSRLEEGELRLRFHPEVVNPVRDLLREQPVYTGLQARAAAWFDARAAAAAGRGEGAAAVRDWREAVFHRFQEKGTAARDFWEERLKDARQFGSGTALPLALEIVGRDYAEAEIKPLPRVSSWELLAAAHAQAAWLYLEADGRDFMAPKHWADFVRHVDRVESLRLFITDVFFTGAVSPALRALREAWESGDPRRAAEVLADPTLSSADPRERLLLLLQRGRALALQGSPVAAEVFREALSLLPEVGPDRIPATVIHLERARCYGRQGRHAAVREALREARASAGEDLDLRFRVGVQDVEYALQVNDFRAAEKGFAALSAMPGREPLPAQLNLLRARDSLIRCQPTAALAETVAVHRITDEPSLRASALECAGEALALSFDFRGALENWESATSLFERAGDVVGVTRCAVLAIALKAKVVGNLRNAAAHLKSTQFLELSLELSLAAEIRLLKAFIDCKNGQKPADPAGVVYWEWESLPPAVRARNLVFGLGFGIRPPEPEFLDELEAGLAALQPLSLRATALDWLEFADAHVTVPAESARRLLALFPRPRRGSADGNALAIRRADLWRVLGWKDEAAKELTGAAPATVIDGWRLELARQRLALSTGFSKLAERIAASDLGNSYLTQVIRWEAQGERGEDGPLYVDPLSGNIGFGPVVLGGPVQPANIWQARRLARLVASGLRAGAPVLSDGILPLLAALEDELGQTLRPPSEPARHEAAAAEEATGDAADEMGLDFPEAKERSDAGKQRVFISESLVPALPADLGPTIDRLVAGWQNLAGELRAVLASLGAGEDVAVQPEGKLAALPWELAGAGYRVSAAVKDRTWPPVSRSHPGAVCLIAPREMEDEVDYGPTTGGRLEDGYAEFGVRAEKVYAVPLDRLGEHLHAAEPPTVLHLVASMREGHYDSGYLDFGSTARRSASFGPRQKGGPAPEETTLSVERLDRLLAAFARPPFLILDIARPSNPAEAVRMLLLRNLYASRLFERGHTRGILGAGLALQNERLPLSARLIQGLLFECPVAARRALAAESWDDLDSTLPRAGVALWSNAPNEPIFIPSNPA